MAKTLLTSYLVAMLAAIAISGCAAAPAPAPTTVSNSAATPATGAPTAGSAASSSAATPAEIPPRATPAVTAEPSHRVTPVIAPRKALATVSFLADIAQNVAGSRFEVTALVHPGTDPHSFEPTPADVARIADSELLIANGAGLEEFLGPVLKNIGSRSLLIEAAAGIPSRKPHEENGAGSSHEADGEHQHEVDPHFWLDPNHVIKYVENIQKGFSEADPDGAGFYAANAGVYIGKLRELDNWIAAQVSQLPQERRLLVTNHESFGYYADRYGFKVVGTVIPSVGTGASPSAQQMAQLIDQIGKTGAKAVFVEIGANPQLAQQIARETGITVITRLYTHSLTAAGGDAPTYLEMMRHNTQAIVEALK